MARGLCSRHYQHHLKLKKENQSKYHEIKEEKKLPSINYEKYANKQTKQETEDGRIVRICSVPECEEMHHARGFCTIHYSKYIKSRQKKKDTKTMKDHEQFMKGRKVTQNWGTGNPNYDNVE